MRGIFTKYFDGRYYTTFRRRVLDQVKGFDHVSGGKGRGKGQPSSGILSESVQLVSECMHVILDTILSNYQTGQQTKRSYQFVL